MKITIDGLITEVESGETILQVARRLGIDIPTLCYHEAFGGQGICRLCLVEVKEGERTRLVASCTYQITREIEVRTSTPEIEKIRRDLIMLLYRRSPNSELVQELAARYNCLDSVEVKDPQERCIMCRLCVKACEEIGAGAISAVFRGTEKRIGTPYDEASPECIGCGACAAVCPTKAIAITKKDDSYAIWNKSFEMVRCSSCGRLFAPQAVMDNIEKKLEEASAEEILCPLCRQKAAARKLAAGRRQLKNVR